MLLQPINRLSLYETAGTAGNALPGAITRNPLGTFSRGLTATRGNDSDNSSSIMTPSTTYTGMIPIATQRSLAIGTGRLTGAGSLTEATSATGDPQMYQRDTAGMFTKALQAYNDILSTSTRIGAPARTPASPFRAGPLDPRTSSVFQNLFA